MPYNLIQTGKNIEITESNEGVYLNLESICEEITKREKNFVIEKVYYIFNDFRCEMEGFLTKLKAGVSSFELFNKANLLEAVESQKNLTNQTILVSQKREAEEKQKVELQEKIYAAKRKSNELTIKDILEQYIGKTIGINIVNPAEMQGAVLVATQSDFFTVNYQLMNFNIPYTQIIRLISSDEGAVSTDRFGSSFALVVKVFDFVIYKGAVGVGVGLPIDF